MATAYDHEEGPVAPKIGWSEKLEQARKYKQEGNEQYKAGDYKAAIRRYHKAHLYLKGIESVQEPLPFPGMGEGRKEDKPPEEVKQEVTKLKVDCFNNLAACLLKVESPNFDKVVQYCDEVLDIVPNNLKAMYRKSDALMHLQRPEDALEILQKAERLPEGAKDPKIRKCISDCEALRLRQEKEVKNTYRAMFQNNPPAETGSKT